MALMKVYLFRNRGGDLLFKVWEEAILFIIVIIEMHMIQSDEADPYRILDQ